LSTSKLYSLPQNLYYFIVLKLFFIMTDKIKKQSFLQCKNWLMVSIFIVSLVFSQKVIAQDSLYIKKIICDLSVPEMYGRGTPYNGDYKAAQYIREELINLNVTPLGINYFQVYPIYGYEMIGDVSVTLGEVTLKNFYDYRLPFHTPSINGDFKIIEAPLEILDYTYENGVQTLSENGLKIWKKFSKKFKKELKTEMFYFNADNIKELLVDSITKLRINKNLELLKIDSTTFFGFSNILIGTSSLPGFGTRPYPEKDFGFFYIKPEFITKKTKNIEVHFDNKMGYRTTQNVVGMVEGTLFPDSFIVFIGHYDHLGMLGDDCIFHGAFDNASGTAYVLALAKYFQQKPLPYSTVFILASGEESGLQGSTFFVNNPLINLQNIKQVLNFDLLCGGNDGILFFNGIDTLCSPFLSVMEEVNKTENLVPKIDKRRNIPNSDHYPFTLQKIPALFAVTMGGGKPPTHHPEDKCDACAVDFSENILKLIILTLEKFN